MLVNIPEGKGPGTWQRMLADSYTDHPRYTAMITCPVCNRYLYCYNHTIAADGQITPSVGHPHTYPPCTWHTFPKLLGWAPVPAIPIYPLFHCGVCARTTRQLSGWGTFLGKDVICPECLALRATR